MDKKYYYGILLSAQVNRYIYIVVYEPYSVLEGLQAVGFQGKMDLTRHSKGDGLEKKEKDKMIFNSGK